MMMTMTYLMYTLCTSNIYLRFYGNNVIIELPPVQLSETLGNLNKKSFYKVDISLEIKQDDCKLMTRQSTLGANSYIIHILKLFSNLLLNEFILNVISTSLNPPLCQSVGFEEI